MNNFDVCRNSLEKRLCIDSSVEVKDSLKVSAEIAHMTKALSDLVELCRPRLIMGGIRYGSSWKHDALMKYMQNKFDAYKATGNMEMLVDLTNFCAIETALKTHPNFHFEAKDR